MHSFAATEPKCQVFSENAKYWQSGWPASKLKQARVQLAASTAHSFFDSESRVQDRQPLGADLQNSAWAQPFPDLPLLGLFALSQVILSLAAILQPSSQLGTSELLVA